MNERTATRRSELTPAGCLLLIPGIALALKLGAVAFALDRGFEIGDEGYYLLNLNHPEGAPETFPFYDLLTLLQPQPYFDVLEARLLRIAVELAATLPLAGGVLRFARAHVFAERAVGGMPFLAFVALGVLLTTGSRSLGYNDVTNLCVYAAIGGIFHLLALPADGTARIRRSASALFIGFATGFEVGVKFSSALLLAGLVAASWIFLLQRLARRERRRLLAWLGAGIALALLPYGIARGGLPGLREDFALVPELARLGGYRPADLLLRFVFGELVTVLQLLLVSAAFAVLLRLLSRRKGPGADARLALAFAAAALFLAVSATLLHPFFLPPLLLCLSVLLLFLFGVLALLYGRLAARLGLGTRSDGLRSLAPLLLLLAAPLVAMAGTNVPLSMRLPAHALPWILAAAVPLFDLASRQGLVRFQAVVTASLALVTSGIVIQHQLLWAYGVPRPVMEQVQAAAGLEGVRVDAGTRDFLETLASRMAEAGYQPGDAILALDYMPGLVFYLGGISPGWNFYVFDKPELNCFNYDRASDHRAPFLLLGRPLAEEPGACVERLEREYAYRPVAEIPFPYQDVFASFGAPGRTHLHVYAPGAVRSGAASEPGR